MYQKIAITVTGFGGRAFFASLRVLAEEGYLKVAGYKKNAADAGTDKKDEEDAGESSTALFQAVQQLKKGQELAVR